MRDVAIVAFAQAPNVRRDAYRNEVEIVMPVVHEAVVRSAIAKGDIGFTCSGSSDFLAGQPFAFVTTLDAVGPWPPIEESHVEMDGAWALYEAWVRLQHGDIDSALVYGFGKSSLGDLRHVMSMQLDPYCTQPLWPDSIALAALQARAMIDAGKCDEREMASIAARSRRNAKANPNAQIAGDFDERASLDEPCIASPLRKHDCAPITDGAAAIVIAADDVARRVSKRPAWIRGIDHRIEPHHLGMRDLTSSPSTALAAKHAGATGRAFDIAELHAPFSHQEVILREALGINGSTKVNPSGGALAANPIMAAGLIRIGEAAQRIIDGEATSAIAHATSGPCLQQNLVCVLEAG